MREAAVAGLSPDLQDVPKQARIKQEQVILLRGHPSPVGAPNLIPCTDTQADLRSAYLHTRDSCAFALS